MLGHDMSWAAFAIIEVMSQERFALKRIGFLAAAQSFTPATVRAARPLARPHGKATRCANNNPFAAARPAGASGG